LVRRAAQWAIQLELSRDESWVFTVLETGRPLTASQISTEALLRLQTVEAALQGLIEKGLVLRYEARGEIRFRLKAMWTEVLERRIDLWPY